ncbi:MAG: RDD family protein [Opitutaceae bacterium]
MRRLRVTTPEGVEFSFRIASPVLRLGALMIDWALISSAWSVVALLLKPLQLISEDAGQGVMIVMYFVLSRGYDVMMDYSWRGQTVGKRVMRLRVVDARGLRLTFAQCVMRNLLRFIDCLPLAYAVGGVASLMSPRGQRLGDLAAGTIVVHEAREPAPDASVMDGQRYNSLRGQAALVARLRREATPEEARAAWQALARREQIEPSARLALYTELAEYFRRLGQIPDALLDGLTDEQQLRNVVDVLYR